MWISYVHVQLTLNISRLCANGQRIVDFVTKMDVMALPTTIPSFNWLPFLGWFLLFSEICTLIFIKRNLTNVCDDWKWTHWWHNIFNKMRLITKMHCRYWIWWMRDIVSSTFSSKPLVWVPAIKSNRNGLKNYNNLLAKLWATAHLSWLSLDGADGNPNVAYTKAFARLHAKWIPTNSPNSVNENRLWKHALTVCILFVRFMSTQYILIAFEQWRKTHKNAIKIHVARTHRRLIKIKWKKVGKQIEIMFNAAV